jgi:hypothetical protein
MVDERNLNLQITNKLQKENHKYQMVRQVVRQAHGPEQSRRTHHHEPSRRANNNDRNSKSQTCFSVTVHR